MRAFRVAALAAVLPLLSGGVAFAGSDPGVPLPTARPVAPVQSGVYCQYDVVGSTIYVGLTVGRAGHGQRTVIEVDRPTSAVALAYPMPARGWLRWTPPGGLTHSRIVVSVAGHKCGRT